MLNGKMTVEFPLTAFKAELPLEGNASCGMILGCGELMISEKVTLVGNIGYRFLTFDEIVSKEDKDMDGDGVIDVKKGEAWPKSAAPEEKVKGQYSGIVLNVGVKFTF